jgi:hypothetical protein
MKLSPLRGSIHPISNKSFGLQPPVRLLFFLCILALCVGCTSYAPTPTPTIAFRNTDGNAGSPVISATMPSHIAATLRNKSDDIDPAQAGQYFRLTRLDNGAEGPPIFGSYHLNGDTLTFQPEFRLGTGAKYRATVTIPGKPPTSLDYDVAAPTAAAEPPAVEKIFPSADVLPANLLKFYIHFTRPMRQTDAIFDHLHILDERGEPVYDPWRRFPQWSDDGKRLTLWIHPGRVKRGVNLREEFGPVLAPGKKYTLHIDETLQDLMGQPLGKPFMKAFTAIEEVHERIVLDKWKLDTPSAGSRDPLVVTFPQPLDQALLYRMLTISDSAGGRRVEGTVEVSGSETVWRFQPATSWQAEQDYTLRVDPLMEDLAGNTPVRVFDTELQAKEKPQGSNGVVRFELR